MNTNARAETLALRRRLYDDIAPLHLSPLWEMLHALVPRQPSTPCVPALWRYDEVRPLLMRAGDAITAEEAVRRVLVLENPSLAGQSAITQSLYAGLQLILPGEVAPSHRHTQSALRFIVEGSGAHTSVNGERSTMQPGDFIITPGWTWHAHGHESDAPVVWLDGLDIPIVRFFDAGFAENVEPAASRPPPPEGTTRARFGFSMAPVRHDPPAAGASPLFSYPYDRTREALEGLEQAEPPDAWDGWKMRYLNPLTGGAPMPTLATFMQRLPAGFSGRASRRTDGNVYSVVEGRGSIDIEFDGRATRFDFGHRDHFVVPSWHTARLSSDAGCTLFSYSDEPVHRALAFHREERT